MALPFFYTDAITETVTQFVLNEETSKHVAQVLRMQNGEQLLLTDGKGNLFTAEIMDDGIDTQFCGLLQKPLKSITIFY